MADQNIIKAIAKWGKDKLGNIIAYKTLTRCVFDDDGNRLSDILASGGTGTAALMTNTDAGVGRPDGTTIEVKENGIFGLVNDNINVDDTLSNTSTNPVQNKVIAEEFQKYAKKIDEEAGSNLFDLIEFQLLGYNVPKDCPVKNEIVGDKFIQKVYVRKLIDLEWAYLTENIFTACVDNDNGESVYHLDTTKKAGLYNFYLCNTSYKVNNTMTSVDTLNHLDAIGNNSDDKIYLKNTGLTGDDLQYAFRNTLSSGLICYELEEPKEIDIIISNQLQYLQAQELYDQINGNNENIYSHKFNIWRIGNLVHISFNCTTKKSISLNNKYLYFTESDRSTFLFKLFKHLLTPDSMYTGTGTVCYQDANTNAYIVKPCGVNFGAYKETSDTDSNPYKTYISCFDFNYNDEIPAGATITFSGLIPIADINFIFLS